MYDSKLHIYMYIYISVRRKVWIGTICGFVAQTRGSTLGKSEARADNPRIVLSTAQTFAPHSAQPIQGSRRQSSDGT